MISGFMSSEKPQPEQPKVAQREKDVYDLLAWLEMNRVKVATMAVILVAVGFGIATVRYFAEQKEVKASGALLALKVPVSAGTNTPAVSAESLMKVSQEYDVTNIVDKVGSGDYFMAGLIYGITGNLGQQDTLEFATAAAVDKMFVMGDATTSSKEHIMKRIKR